MTQPSRPPFIVWGVLACILAAIVAACVHLWRETLAIAALAWLLFRK